MHRSRVLNGRLSLAAATPLYVIAVLSLPLTAAAQNKQDKDDDALSGMESDSESKSDASSSAGPGQLPADTEETATPPAAPDLPATPPVTTPVVAAPPSPFVFTLKGTIAGTIFMQDAPFASGNGTGALYGPTPLIADKWFLGGDVRQARLNFAVRGPEVLGGAIPTGVVEIEMFGGNQITTLPATTASLPVKDPMGMTVGTVTVPTVTTSPWGDESVIPRLRTAYVELNWNSGADILRVGQYHNLLLAMVSASAAHPATLGYAAGQLGWRSPGITYLHRFKLGEDTNFDVGLQINRNSWIDNAAVCPSGAAATPMNTPPVANCLPYGVSLGEAGLPQIQARLSLSGGKADSPWITYAPTVWQVYAVMHYDQKDLSGLGNVATVPGTRDSMTSLIFEGGFKLKLGPVLIASNGWVGSNAGSVYGNIIQLQTPDKGDVSGFGTWGQVGLSFTKNISLWGLGGIDKPNQVQAIAANFSRLQNIQLGFMLAYTDGPLAVALEWFYNATTMYLPPTMPSATNPAGTVASTIVNTGNQPSATVTYTF